MHPIHTTKIMTLNADLKNGSSVDQG